MPQGSNLLYMKHLHEAPKAFIKYSGIQKYFSSLSSIFQRVRLGFGLIAVLVLIHSSSFAQEQPWPQKKVDEYRKKAYAGDVESYDALARHYLLRAMDNNEITPYGENMEAGLAINSGMWARSHDRLKKAYVNYWNGRYYFQARDYADAFKRLERSTLVTIPGKPYAHLLIAKMLDEGLGRKEENYRALTHYRMATETDIKETSRQAYFMMGRLYLNELKSAEKALKNLQASFDQGFTKAEELLNKAREQVEAKRALLEENPILATETEYYDTVLEKTRKANETINTFHDALEALYKDYNALTKRQKQSLIDFKKKHHDLSKPKTEFETREQFNTRITEYQALEEAHKKAYSDSITSLLSAFTPYKTKRSSEKSFFFGEFRNTKNLRKEYGQYLSLATKYSPELKSYETSHIGSLVYNAETEIFTISYQAWADGSNKEYRVFVPRAEAQAFKEQKKQNQYYFFLDEPRVILSNGKAYKVITGDSWHKKVHCPGFDPTLTSDDAFKRKYFDFSNKTEVLVNGKPYSRGFFQKKVEQYEPFKKLFTEASANKKFFGRKNWRAIITLTYSDKKSQLMGKTEVDYDADIRFLDPNFLDDNLDQLLAELYGVVYGAIKDVEVTLQAQNCQTQDTQFEFEVSFLAK